MDLDPSYPRGVLCFKLQARLFPAVPERDEVLEHGWGPLAEAVGAMPGLLVAESELNGRMPVEVGRE